MSISDKKHHENLVVMSHNHAAQCNFFPGKRACECGLDRILREHTEMHWLLAQFANLHSSYALTNLRAQAEILLQQITQVEENAVPAKGGSAE